MPFYKDVQFSNTELARYDRHLLLPGFGLLAQQKLKAARVLVVGAGGLGNPLLLYLATAGVGTIGIVDFDTVEDSNLPRHVLFGTKDRGRSKARAAKTRLTALNPHIDIRLHHERLSLENALHILENYEVVVDCTDNFSTHYLINDACVLLDKTNVYASATSFAGEVSVFNYMNDKGELGPNYRDLYPLPPMAKPAPNGVEGGVLSVLPGVVGSVQALETIKVITDTGEPLIGRLFLFDALRCQTRLLNIQRRDDNPLNGRKPTMTKLTDYERLSCPSQISVDKPVKEISLYNLKGEILTYMESEYSE